MNSYKRSVPLCTLVPGDNPRKDFGDLDAMAATIELLPAAVDDDYVPTEEDLWLLSEAELALAEHNAKEDA